MSIVPLKWPEALFSYQIWDPTFFSKCQHVSTSNKKKQYVLSTLSGEWPTAPFLPLIWIENHLLHQQDRLHNYIDFKKSFESLAGRFEARNGKKGAYKSTNNTISL